MPLFSRLQRRLDAHPFAVDAVQAALFGGVFALVSVDLAAGVAGGVAAWVLAMAAPLAWRRVRPVPSAVAVFGVGLVQVLVGPVLLLPGNLLVLVALYSVTRYGPRWSGSAAMAGMVAGGGLLAIRAVFEIGALREGVATGGVLGVFVVVSGLATWSFALFRRSREETLDALRDRADRLERERDQQRQLAAADERARIAREMHDVVAHSLSVVIAQADGGRYAAKDDPEAAVRVLGTIGETGRTALADMRRILGVLRAGPVATPDASDGASAAPGGPALTPQPASADLDRLVEQLRSAGVHVSLVRLGTPRELPGGMGLTVYRIVQEALTNVLKHAGPDPDVTVLQQWTDDHLLVQVDDDGRGAAADDDGAGQGLLGMRERAALFGGTVAAGPRPGAGYRVRAELPLAAPPVIDPYATAQELP